MQSFFSRAGEIVLYCLRVSLGGAATLFGKVLVCGLEGAAFAMCVDALGGFIDDTFWMNNELEYKM
jgi:hypothetical protein